MMYAHYNSLPQVNIVSLTPTHNQCPILFLVLQGLHLSSNDHKFKTPEPLSSNDSFLNLKIFRAPKTFLFLKFIEISFLVPESQENHCSYQFANHAKSRLQLCLPESNEKKKLIGYLFVGQVCKICDHTT